MRDVNDLSTKWSKALFEPHPAVTDPQQRQTARVLAAVTLALLVFNTLASALYFVFAHAMVSISLVTEAIFLAVYLLSRSRRPVAGSWLLVLSISCAIFVQMSGAENPVSGMVWVIFPAMLAAVLLTLEATLAVALLNFVTAIVYVTLTPATHFDAAMTPLLVIAFAGLMTLIAKYTHERDIRGLESQARELDASRQRYRHLFNDVPIGLYQMDPTGQILRVNPVCAKLLGFPNPDALVAVNMHTLFVDTARREQWRHMLEREGTLQRFEWQVQFPDGRRVWVAESAHMVTDAEGQVLYYQGSIEDITLQRQARQEMLRQKEYWEALIVHSPVAIVTLDLQHKIVSVNVAFESLFGYRLEQVIGHNLDTLIVPAAEKIDAAELTGKVLARGETIHTITQRRRRNGTLVDVELAGAPVILDGQQVGALMIYQDITQRKQTERELISRQARLEMLNKVAFRVAEMTELPEIMTTIVEYARWAATADVAVIAALDRETGRVAQVFSANYPMEVIPEGAEIAGHGILGLVLQGNLVHSPDVTLEPGYVGYPDWHPRIRACLGVPIKYGERTSAIMLLGNTESQREFTMIDREVILTLSHLAAVALHTAHQFTELTEAVSFQREILDTAATAVYTVDTGLHITSINAAFTEITGYTADEVVGKPCSLLSGDPCMHHCGLFDVQRATPIYRQECEITDKQGRRLTIIKNANLIRNERGQTVGGIESFMDVTELIEARRNAEAASRVKGEFLANMSHELRTPLNAILGFVQLMQRSASFPAEHIRNLHIISQSGETLLELINDVLDMSKIEAGRIAFEPSNLDLYAMVDEVLAMFTVHTDKKELWMKLECAADVPQFIWTDERKLRQVLINLLSNAVKFTEKGGVTLHITTKAPHGTPEAIATTLREQLLHFEVQDTGVGIAPEEMDQLFKAFTQTASGKRTQEGTGLGLPISRRFVQMMGGDLIVHSQIGQGSSFMFDIQVQQIEADQVTSAKPTRQVISLAPDQPEYRVLVVDDRVENRMLIQQLLESVGFSIREAANGQEAIAIHETWRPHLVFMDIRMPVMDGHEATQRIKATPQGAATIVVALTASTLEADHADSILAGCDDYIHKPIRDTEIFGTLARHLNVRYIYADQDASDSKHEATAAQLVLTSQVLETLPVEWRNQLRDAATRARSDLVLALVEEIAPHHQAIASALAQFVDEFQFDRIIALLAHR